MRPTLLLLSFACAMPALAQDEALENCRKLAEPMVRLACYDAIPTRTPGVAPPPGRAASAAVQPATPTAAPPASSAAPAVASPSHSTALRATPAAQPSGPAAPAVAPSAVDSFGLPQRARDTEIQSITTSVGKDFAGWGPNERLRLDNGQVWQVVDGSVVAVRPGSRKVVVRRGVLGSFFLDFEGVTQSPRVRRIQ